MASRDFQPAEKYFYHTVAETYRLHIEYLQELLLTNSASPPYRELNLTIFLQELRERHGALIKVHFGFHNTHRHYFIKTFQFCYNMFLNPIDCTGTLINGPLPFVYLPLYPRPDLVAADLEQPDDDQNDHPDDNEGILV